MNDFNKKSTDYYNQIRFNKNNLINLIKEYKGNISTSIINLINSYEIKIQYHIFNDEVSNFTKKYHTKKSLKDSNNYIKLVDIDFPNFKSKIFNDYNNLTRIDFYLKQEIFINDNRFFSLYYQELEDDYYSILFKLIENDKEYYNMVVLDQKTELKKFINQLLKILNE